MNCHLTQEIGTEGMSRIVNENFENIHFKRKDAVVSLAKVTNSVKINKANITVDALTLFCRMCVAKQSDEDLKQ